MRPHEFKRGFDSQRASMRKTILVLTSTFPRWANDVEPPFVFELCRRLSDAFRIHVLAPHDPGAAREETLDGMRISRFRYCASRWERLCYSGGILANLRRSRWRYLLVPCFLAAQTAATAHLLRKHRFDCIHAHWLIPQGLSALAARRLAGQAPPLICTSHGGDLFGLNRFGLDRLKQSVAGQSAAVTVVSRAMQRTLVQLGADPDRVQTIPMGVDLLHRFVPPPSPSQRAGLLFVGRLVEKKGPRYLIEAMPAILERQPRTFLRIAGDGQQRPQLEKRASELGVASRVEFLGAVDNAALPELYQRAEVVIFPSVVAGDGDREGFGLVLVEALGCECATVVTDLPAMRDIVADGRSALIVRQKDAPGIATRVIRLLGDPGLRRSIGKAGRRFVLEHFDWEPIARRYARLMETVTGRRAAGGIRAACAAARCSPGKKRTENGPTAGPS
jgi:glycosyltransferase involved in cell wall biosynthesis